MHGQDEAGPEKEKNATNHVRLQGFELSPARQVPRLKDHHASRFLLGTTYMDLL